MTELVREHIGLREISRRAEAPLQLVEEAQIEIDLVIAGTVERPGRCLREAARRLNLIAEQRDDGTLVAAAQRVLPGRLHVLGDGIDEVDELLFSGRRADAAGGADGLARCRTAAEQRKEIDAGENAEQ